MENWYQHDEFVAEKLQTIVTERFCIINRIMQWEDQNHTRASLNKLFDIWQKEDTWASIMEADRAADKEKMSAESGCPEHRMH
jgi:hypothetical protein